MQVAIYLEEGGALCETQLSVLENGANEIILGNNFLTKNNIQGVVDTTRMKVTINGREYNLVERPSIPAIYHHEAKAKDRTCNEFARTVRKEWIPPR
jgi:hypothetical protein